MQSTSHQATYHTEIFSEIIFLKKEMDFLLKILRNCYSSSINLEKIKTLDSYWGGFEKNIEGLNQLLSSNALFNEEELLIRYKRIEKEVKKVKESFYEYMHECECSIRTLKVN